LASVLADRQLDRPPAEEVQRTRMVATGRRMIARVDGRQPFAVAVQDESGLRRPVRGSGLEVDEMTGPQRRPPPGEIRVARPEAELTPLAGLEKQVVEPIQGDLGRLRRGREAVADARRRDAAIVPDDGRAVVVGLADPLADDFEIPAKTSSSDRPGSGRLSRWRDGWISSI